MRAGKKTNFPILIITAILVVFGLFMITSASAVVSQEKFGQSFYFVKNQILKGLIPGVILGYFAYRIRYSFWRKTAKYIFLIGIILMALVFVPGLGLKLGGATRWIQFGDFSFQPSEVFKLAFIIYLAAFLENISESRNTYRLQRLFSFAAIVGIVGGLITLQRDLGTLGVFCLTALAMYFMAQAPLSHIFFLSGLGISVLLVLVRIFPHASQRIQTFIHPELQTKGISYQLEQALIALGSGGIFGKGLSQGKQKFLYLPQPASDSIVAVIGEETGFLGLLALTSVFAAFGLQGVKIAQKAPDNFSRLLALGITSLIVIQAFINISAVIGLIPLTGITLPFVSYGGTSLVMSLVAVGILLNISKYAKT